MSIFHEIKYLTLNEDGTYSPSSSSLIFFKKDVLDHLDKIEVVNSLNNGANIKVTDSLDYPVSRIRKWITEKKNEGFVYSLVRSDKKCTHYVSDEHFDSLVYNELILCKVQFKAKEYINGEILKKPVNQFILVTDENKSQLSKIGKLFKVYEIVSYKNISPVNDLTYLDLLNGLEDLIEIQKNSKFNVKVIRNKVFKDLISSNRVMTKDNYLTLKSMFETDNYELAISLIAEYDYFASQYWIHMLNSDFRFKNHSSLNLSNNRPLKDFINNINAANDIYYNFTYLNYLSHAKTNTEWQVHIKETAESNLINSMVNGVLDQNFNISIGLDVKEKYKVYEGKYRFK